jgi:hypothetical protein
LPVVCARAPAQTTASGATRVAGSLNFKEKYAPDFPRVKLHLVQTGRKIAASELERLGLVAAPEAGARPTPVSPAYNGSFSIIDLRVSPALGRMFMAHPPGGLWHF